MISFFHKSTDVIKKKTSPQLVDEGIIVSMDTKTVVSDIVEQDLKKST